jgi:uncharacterized protein YfaS (alpha-2-macroglobulin family)
MTLLHRRMPRTSPRRAPSWLPLAALAALLAAPAAQALQITRFSPQGEAAQVRQAVARFDAPAVAAGNPQAAAPLAVRCSPAEAGRGAGRWNGEREWVYDFAADLPPGTRCSATVEPGFKSVDGQGVAGTRSYQFNSGGPFVQDIWPGGDGPIEENQSFLLRLSGPATVDSLKAHVWCAVDGLGEKVPVRMVEGGERKAILEGLRRTAEAAKDPLRWPTLACNRSAAAGARIKLVYGPGVATPAAGAAAGVANAVERRFAYRVRQPFEAEFSCQRENAQAACLPIRPMSLRFNAPVTRRQAEGIRLETLAGEGVAAAPARAPRLQDDEDRGDGRGRDPARKPDPDALVTGVEFPPGFAEKGRYRIVLPSGFRDAAGRAPANADSFPLAVQTAALPPMAKFAASPFGIVERYAEPDARETGKGMLPVTLRSTEGLPAGTAEAARAGTVSDLRLTADADIIAWLRKVERYDEREVDRKAARADVAGRLPRALPDERGRPRDTVESRAVSLLAGKPGVRTLELPQKVPGDPRPFEVVGIPLDPGFHVVEIASKRLGDALLDPGYGADRPLVARTSALVTNLAVHFKLGREGSVAWVTSLDQGKPVAGAAVRVSACDGREIAVGRTDARGIARFDALDPEPPECAAGRTGGDYKRAYFVSARAATPVPGRAGRGGPADAAEDLAFTWTDSNQGIESWRFDVPTGSGRTPDTRAHTVFDRTLLRAGETVSMKHLIRTETSKGFGLPQALPSELVVTHVGSGQEFVQPVAWRRTATGGQSAESRFAVPKAARLGGYAVALRHGSADGRAARPGDSRARDEEGEGGDLATGEFRVEEFRLPVLAGRIAPQQQGALIAPQAVPTQVQVSYVSGGGASGLPVQVSALVRERSLDFPDYRGFRFTPPLRRAADGSASADDPDEGEDADAGGAGQRVVADKLRLALDRDGAGAVALPDLPAVDRPQELLLEATYADPSGEVQTLRNVVPLWPAGVVAGIRTEGWASVGRSVAVQALALDLQGRPKAGVPLAVRAVLRNTVSSRKRLVGGFYAYDNRREVVDLGEVCSGKSDAQGLLACEVASRQAGQVELVVTAKDDQGRASRAARTVWVARQGELWFGGEDHDRIDVLAERPAYAPGETAVLQVRMPFRSATALVSVEREGVLQTQVVELSGRDPTVRLKVDPAWGPNVYVSVLALRGRLREVPWYSFFTWGWQAPRAWWSAFRHEGRDYAAPTALVDLSKPAYRLGMAELRVGAEAHRIDVRVATDRETYPVRGTARVTVKATLPGGKPAAGAEVALAAVDQALLELMPNASWNLLDAMMQRRAWGVETSTAQMEVIGRRHYGRKAVPAGGGGGRSNARELFDTLLLWNPKVVLDAQGQATVEVPLNDALTSFRIVAVADAGTGFFGTGAATVRATQDLQIIGGLPPLVREGDRFRAQVTLRNTTKQAMKVEVTARAAPLELAPRTVDLPAGESREVAWDAAVPEAPEAAVAADALRNAPRELAWEIAARTLGEGGAARDTLRTRQRIVPAVPLTVRQAGLLQLDGEYAVPVAAPDGGLPGRGGLSLALQPRLADGLPGVRDWFARYPYGCLEQQASRSIGLRDAAMWRAVLAQMPGYVDDDGLAGYFPGRPGYDARGSDTLTAYLLAATHEAAGIDPAFALPPALVDTFARGLAGFVEGRIQRDFWAPRKDLELRKLSAIEALSRHGRATARMADSIAVAPNQWPTHAVIDWLAILRRLPGIARRDERLQEATQVLQARLSYQGTRMVFSTESTDGWWWLMQNGDANAARLLLAVLEDPAWKDDMGRMAAGLIGRQQGGAWQTTTANLWGGLALQKFSARFESAPVAGTTVASLGGARAAVDWSRVGRAAPAVAGAPGAAAAGASASAGRGLGIATGGASPDAAMFLPWSAAGPQGRGTLSVVQQGTGRPWLTWQSIAAVPPQAPVAAGYRVRRTVEPVEQGTKGKTTRGDIWRVTIDIDAQADMAWVALTDPVPGGATILGGGLGRDSEIATRGERSAGGALAAFEERGFESYRAYYEYLPKGKTTVQYTVRLNNAGDFALPPTRIEALYAPEMFGEAPNARVVVEPSAR